MTTNTTNAVILRGLHMPGRPLVLPNAWDAASARLVEAAGFPVVATSSYTMADVLGYDDGETAPVKMLAAAARIVRALRVTVDFERGYRLAPAELVERFAATGAVGLNLEDSDPSSGEMIDAAEQADFLASVRAAATSAGIDLVIKARTDSFVRRAGSRQEQRAASIDRGARHLGAVADCVYPIAAALDADTIRVLVEGISRTCEHRLRPGTLSLAELAALGVARVSFGPTLQGHLYDTFRALLSTNASDETTGRWELAIVALGILVVLAPSAVPGLRPAM